MHKLVRILLTSTFFLQACLSATEKKLMVQEYPDTKGLLESSIKYYLSSRPLLSKHSCINSQYDSIQYAPDTIEWKNEFLIFDQANLNLPNYVGMFITNEKQIGQNKDTRYISFKPAKTDVDSATFIYQNEKLSSFTIYINKQNKIYTTQLTLGAEIGYTSQNIPFINQYTVYGHEKFGNDSTYFKTEGKVLLP